MDRKQIEANQQEADYEAQRFAEANERNKQGFSPAQDPVAAQRKATPIASGVLAYFPDALAEVARVSKIGNDQHNPGQPLHWAKEKSTDELDALARHLSDRLRGEVFDTDTARHLGKVAWRALAALQREIEAERASK